MASETPLTYESFLTLARDAGLDTGPDADQDHLQELYSYVKPVLASLRSLDSIDVSQVEPDMSFVLHPA